MMNSTKKDRVAPNDKTAFWESSFREKQAMWGFEPSDSAILARDIFLREGAKNILVPGVGYGRNAQIFIDNGIKVTGIEISETAIALARKHYGTEVTIYHGSVTDMPFDNLKYDGIFCYALIHLLNGIERKKLIEDCFNQLLPDSSMIFSVISKKAPTYGTGKKISEDQYEIVEGVHLYFYDRESIQSEFGEFGLFEILDIEEQPIKNPDQYHFPFFLIKCRKDKVENQ